jgi:glycosyltransferase involved in cell wall biosynthesis
VKKEKVLILYEELANYFVSCLNKYNEMFDVEIHVFRKTPSQLAPFSFNFTNLHVYDRENFNYKELIQIVKSINPQLIFCGGWAYKPYLKLVDYYHGKIPTVIGFDNKWTGTFKQQLASIYARLFITNKFNYCFVPGLQQRIFARKLGFEDSQIVLGAYSCDFEYFHNQYLTNQKEKELRFPKRFLYVGRYLEFKGVLDLWQAFIELHKEFPNDWELWCVGNGPVDAVGHNKIRHFGFIQPNNMSEIISKTGVFILPSHSEPWGVVVHEFSSAGFPLICSNKVGANEGFLEDGENGFVFESGSVHSLKLKMKNIIEMSDIELNKMGVLSVEKANLNTPELWVMKFDTFRNTQIK